MSSIIPSVRLKVVSVSKLSTTPCLRQYFWKYIMNLEGRRIYLPFWFGGVLGAGFEALLLGKPVKAALRKEHLKRTEGYDIDDEMKEELKLQLRLIAVILDGAKCQPSVKRMKLTESQIKFCLKLKDSGVLYCGTEDGEGTYRGQGTLFEIKAMSANYANSAFLTSLTYGKQINGYAWARRSLGKSTVGQCCACVFKKPGKKLKRGQSIDDFVEEIRKDVLERPDMYFIWHQFNLGKQTVDGVGADIEREAYILKMLYLDCGKDILDPLKWPKRENKCHDYAGCEFIQLCKNMRTWKLYLRYFRQREMLYKEEEGELA